MARGDEPRIRETRFTGRTWLTIYDRDLMAGFREFPGRRDAHQASAQDDRAHRGSIQRYDTADLDEVLRGSELALHGRARRRVPLGDPGIPDFIHRREVGHAGE